MIKWEFAGQTYWLYFSVATLFELGNNFGEKGTLESILRAILPPEGSFDTMQPEIFANVLMVAETLMAAGAEYQRLTGDEQAATLTAEELKALLNPQSYMTLHAAVIKAIQESMKRTVEVADDPKKAETTQGN